MHVFIHQTFMESVMGPFDNGNTDRRCKTNPQGSIWRTAIKEPPPIHHEEILFVITLNDALLLFCRTPLTFPNLTLPVSYFTFYREDCRADFLRVQPTELQQLQEFARTWSLRMDKKCLRSHHVIPLTELQVASLQLHVTKKESKAHGS